MDVLRICGDGFTKTDFNVLSSDIRSVYRSDVTRAHLAGQRALCTKCKQCPIQAICGGGYPPHRYSSVNGFDNPSVYCRDLMKLVTHIQRTIVATLSEPTRRKLNIAPSV